MSAPIDIPSPERIVLIKEPLSNNASPSTSPVEQVAFLTYDSDQKIDKVILKNQKPISSPIKQIIKNEIREIPYKDSSWTEYMKDSYIITISTSILGILIYNLLK